MFEQGIFKETILNSDAPGSLQELCAILEIPQPPIPKNICLAESQAARWQPALHQALTAQSAHANLTDVNSLAAFAPTDCNISSSQPDLELLTQLSLTSPPTLRRQDHHRDIFDVMSQPDINVTGLAPPMPDFNNLTMMVPQNVNSKTDGPQRRDSGYAETKLFGGTRGSIHGSQCTSFIPKKPDFDINTDETYFSHSSFGSFGSSSSFASQVYGNEDQWQAEDELVGKVLPQQRKRPHPRITDVVSPNSSALHTDSLEASPTGPARKRKFDDSDELDEEVPERKAVAVKTTQKRTALNKTDKADKAKAVNRKATASVPASSKTTKQPAQPEKTTQSKATSNKVTKPSLPKKTAASAAATSSTTIKKKSAPLPPPAKRFQPTPRTQNRQPATTSNKSIKSSKQPTKREKKPALRDFEEGEYEEEDCDDTGTYGTSYKKRNATSVAKQRHLMQGGGRGKPIHIE
jgi:hypothetical protein